MDGISRTKENDLTDQHRLRSKWAWETRVESTSSDQSESPLPGDRLSFVDSGPLLILTYLHGALFAVGVDLLDDTQGKICSIIID